MSVCAGAEAEAGMVHTGVCLQVSVAISTRSGGLALGSGRATRLSGGEAALHAEERVVRLLCGA